MPILSLNASTLRPTLPTSADTQMLARAVERLSTGTRINRASDDPTNLGVSQGLQRQARSQTSAARNANDAISMIQTAEAALNNISAMLDEIYGLSTRSVNESFTGDQRKLIVSRISDLRDEINATVDRTTFNNAKLLQGDFSTPVSGQFNHHLGELASSGLAVRANSTFKPGFSSSIDVSGATTIRVSEMDTSGALEGSYKFSNDGAAVTLTRTVNRTTTSQSLTLVDSTPRNTTEVQIPRTWGDTFTLNFDQLGVSSTFVVDEIGSRNSAIDFATLIGSVGTVPSATGWQAVSGANTASGDATDQVVATVVSTGGNLKLGTTAGLTAISGYGAAATWTDGSTAELGFTGTVAQVNTALQSLQVNAQNGLGSIDVAITAQFENSVFLDSTVESTVGTKVTIPGWEIYKERLTLGTTNVGGWQSSNSDNTMPGNSPAYATTTQTGTTFNYQFTADLPAGVTGQSLRLFSSNMTTDSYGVVHGPYLVSRDPIQIKSGDTITFDWKSAAGSDAYDSYAYLLNVDNGSQIELLDVHGLATNATTPWTSASLVVPTTGNYKFVFTAGTYDFSGGRAAGGSLYVTNIQVTPAVPEPNALRAINIGTGGEFSINQATEINGVWTTGVSSTAAEDGTYRLVADASAGTLTLNQYYDNTPTLTRSETIHQGRATNPDESRTFYFEALGVAVSLGNRAKDALWFGNEQSGLTAEIKIAENQRISIDGNAPSFKISDGSKFDIRLDELRDVRLGENDDNENADVFNALNAAVTLLAAHRNPSLESLSDLSGLTKAAIDRISDLRTSLGATSNRLFAAVNSIDSQLFSISSNRNRIESTDYAQETSRLVRLQANQSAYLATLAHMNTQPQMVLWLLQ